MEKYAWADGQGDPHKLSSRPANISDPTTRLRKKRRGEDLDLNRLAKRPSPSPGPEKHSQDTDSAIRAESKFFIPEAAVRYSLCFQAFVEDSAAVEYSQFEMELDLREASNCLQEYDRTPQRSSLHSVATAMLAIFFWTDKKNEDYLAQARENESFDLSSAQNRIKQYFELVRDVTQVIFHAEKDDRVKRGFAIICFMQPKVRWALKSFATLEIAKTLCVVFSKHIVPISYCLVQKLNNTAFNMKDHLEDFILIYTVACKGSFTKKDARDIVEGNLDDCLNLKLSI